MVRVYCIQFVSLNSKQTFLGNIKKIITLIFKKNETFEITKLYI